MNFKNSPTENETGKWKAKQHFNGMSLLHRDGAFCSSNYHCCPQSLCYRNNEQNFWDTQCCFMHVWCFLNLECLLCSTFLTPDLVSHLSNVRSAPASSKKPWLPRHPPRESMANSSAWGLHIADNGILCSDTVFWFVSISVSHKKQWTSQGQELCVTPISIHTTNSD